MKKNIIIEDAIVYTNSKQPKINFFIKAKYVLGINCSLTISHFNRSLEYDAHPEIFDYCTFRKHVLIQQSVEDLLVEVKDTIKTIGLSRYFQRKFRVYIDKIIQSIDANLSLDDVKPIFEFAVLLIQRTDFGNSEKRKINPTFTFDLIELISRIVNHPDLFLDVEEDEINKYFTKKYDSKDVYKQESWDQSRKNILLHKRSKKLGEQAIFYLYMCEQWKESFESFLEGKIKGHQFLSKSYRVANTIIGEFPWVYKGLSVISMLYSGRNDVLISLLSSDGELAGSHQITLFIDRESPSVVPISPAENSRNLKKDIDLTIELDGMHGFNLLNLDVDNLAFVGDVRSKHLNAVGVFTIRDLLSFDPLHSPYKGITLWEMQKIFHRTKLLEKSKFRLEEVLYFVDMSLKDFLTIDFRTYLLPPDISLHGVNNIVNKVRTILLSLDDKVTKTIRIGDLVYAPKTEIESLSLFVDGQDLTSNSSLIGTRLQCSPKETWSDGQHYVQIHVEDKAGNESDHEYFFDVDAAPPRIEITSPVEGVRLNDQQVVIFANLTDLKTGVDKNSITIKINGEDYTSQAVIDNASLSLIFRKPKEGDYKIAIQCADNNGNISEPYERNFSIDRTAPKITLDEKQNGKIVWAEEITVTGHVIEEKLAELKIGGKIVRPRKDGSFVTKVKVVPGNNPIQAVAIDTAGNDAFSNMIYILRLNDNLCAFQGQVVYADSKEPAIGARVIDLNSGKATVVGEAGNFTLGDLTKELHMVRIIPLPDSGNTAVAIEVDLRMQRVARLGKAIHLHKSLLADDVVDKYIVPEGISIAKKINDSTNRVTLNIKDTAKIKMPDTGRSIAIKTIDATESPLPLPPHINAAFILQMEPSGLKLQGDDIELTLSTGMDLHSGMPMIMYSYDERSGAWKSAGLGKIQDDGSTYKSLPNAGIRHFSAIAVSPIPPVLNSRNEENSSANADAMNGAVLTKVELPGFVSMNTERKPKLVYNSFAASPKVILSAQFKGLLEIQSDPVIIYDEPFTKVQEGHIQKQKTEVVDIYRERSKILFWRDRWERLDKDEVDEMLQDEGVQRVTVSEPIYLPVDKATPFEDSFPPGEEKDGVRVDIRKTIIEEEQITFFKFNVQQTVEKHQHTWLQAISGDYQFSAYPKASFRYEGDMQTHGPVPFPGEVDQRKEFPTLPENLDIAYIIQPKLDNGDFYSTGVYSSMAKYFMEAGGVTFSTQTMKSNGDFTLDSGYLAWMKEQLPYLYGYSRHQAQSMIDFLEKVQQMEATGEVSQETLEISYTKDPLEQLIRSQAGANIVHNLSQSSFGSGWGLEETQQIIPIDASRILAIGPEGKQIFSVENRIYHVVDHKSIALCKDPLSENIYSIAETEPGQYGVWEINRDKTISIVATLPKFEKIIDTTVRRKKINYVRESPPYDVAYTEFEVTATTSKPENEVAFKYDNENLIERTFIAADLHGNIFVSDFSRNRIYKISKSGESLTLNNPVRSLSTIRQDQLRWGEPTSGEILADSNDITQTRLHRDLVSAIASPKTYKATLHKLYCSVTEDATGADECILKVVADGSRAYNYGPAPLNNGQTWPLNLTYTFNSSLNVKLWDQDDDTYVTIYNPFGSNFRKKIFSDPDDYLGENNIPHPQYIHYGGVGYFKGDGASYALHYRVTNEGAFNAVESLKSVYHIETTVVTNYEDFSPGSTKHGQAISGAKLNQPCGITTDKEDNLIIAEKGSNLIRKFNFQTGKIETIAGIGSGVFDLSTKPALQAVIPSPIDVAYSDEGELYVLMNIGGSNQAIGKIDLLGNFVYIGGTLPGEKGSIDQGINAQFFNFRDIEKIKINNGKVYCLVQDGHQIIVIDKDGLVSLLSGNGEAAPLSSDEGLPASEATLSYPQDMVFTDAGNLLVADTGHSKLKLVNLTSNDTFGNSRLKGPKGYLDSYIEYDAVRKGWSRTYKDNSVVQFNRAGLHEKTLDRNSNVTSYAYDVDGKIISATYPGNSSLNFDYSADGFLQKIIDHAGRTTQFNVINGHLSEVILPDALPRSFEYASDGSLTGQTYGNGARIDYSLDIHGRLISAQSGLQNSTALLSEVHGENNNASVILATNSKKAVQQPSGATVEYKEENGIVTEITNGGGGTSSIAYNSNGQLDTIVSASGEGITNTYNQAGEITLVSDNSGNSLQQTIYDSLDRRVQETDAAGYVMYWDYDDNGNIKEIKKGNVVVATYEYHTGGQLHAGNEFGQETVIDYDEYGNISSIAQGNYTQRFDRNLSGSPERITEGDYLEKVFQYDDLNRVVKVSEEADTTEYGYDEKGKKSTILDPLGNSYHYAYNEHGGLIERLDLSGRIYSYSYSDDGRMETMSLPDGAQVSWEYNNSGNFIREISGDYKSETSYAAEEKLEWARNPHLHSNIQYDTKGNKIGSLFLFPGVGEIEITTGRKLNGMLSSLAVKGLETNIQLAYNTSGFLDNITAQNYKLHYQYDDHGRPVQVNFANGASVAYGYDISGRISSIKSNNGKGWSSSRDYTYSSAGDMESMAKDNDTLRFGYTNYKGQLSSVERNGVVEQTYEYDALYNRVAGSNGINSLSKNGDLLLEDDNWRYEYDLRGNLLKRENKNSSSNEIHLFEYDHRNLLVEFHIEDGEAQPKLEASYRYGALGERIKKKLVYREAPDKNYTRRYVYDDGRLLLELDENLNIIKQYILNGLSDAPSGFICEGKAYYFIKDHKQSIEFILDENGDVVNHYDYDAFGNRITLSSAIENDLAYCSKNYDEESSLYYSLARHYDPVTGRFLQPDPILHERPVGTVMVNQYVYALANPLRYSDPSGLDWIDDLVLIIVAVVVLAVAAVVSALTFGAGTPFAASFSSFFLGGLAFGLWGGAGLAVVYGTYALFNGKNFFEYAWKGFAIGFSVGTAIYSGLNSGGGAGSLSFSSLPSFFGSLFSILASLAVYVTIDYISNLCKWLINQGNKGPMYDIQLAKTCATIADLSYEGLASFYQKMPPGFKIRTFISNRNEFNESTDTIEYLKLTIKENPNTIEVANNSVSLLNLMMMRSGMTGYQITVNDLNSIINNNGIIVAESIVVLLKLLISKGEYDGPGTTVEELQLILNKNNIVVTHGVHKLLALIISKNKSDGIYTIDGMGVMIKGISNYINHLNSEQLLMKSMLSSLEGVKMIVHTPVTATDSNAYILEYDKGFIIAFRGSELKMPLTDWITDATTLPALGTEYQFHFGFHQAFASLGESLINELIELYNQYKIKNVKFEIKNVKDNTYIIKYPDPEVIITGHSLGGALSTICAYYCRKSFIPVSSVYTFGAPRVANKEFATYFNRHVCPQTFRFINDEDIVPKIPFMEMGYYHVNQSVHLEGTLNELPPSYEGDPAVDHFEWTWGSQWEEVKDGIISYFKLTNIEGIMDHSMGGYIENIDKLIKNTEK